MIPRHPNEPFESQLEWLDHRYDPGHFLGGVIRPELRARSLGWRAKRLAGIQAFAGGASALATLAALTLAAGLPPDPWTLTFAVLSLLAGFRLWKAAAAQGPPRDPRATSEPRQLLQATLMAAAGTAVVAGIAAGALAVLTMSRAISGGAVDVLAALLVVVALVVIVRERRRLARRG